MSALPSTYERNRLRRSLVQLASLLVLTLLACGLVGLFALWSMERQHVRAEARQVELLQAVDHARNAQVAFKIQVQSWKNLLLRGAVAADYEVAWRDFEGYERTADDSLKAITAATQSAVDPELAAAVSALLGTHAQVGESYRAAKPTAADVLRLRDRADAAVRGVDRSLNSAIDKLVSDMLATYTRDRDKARLEEERRVGLLSRAIWIMLGLSLLLVSILLWRTLRDPALHA